MRTLSYGYLLPESPDTGDKVFPAIMEDIEQLNDHDHDGVNSAPLAFHDVTIPLESWEAVAGLIGLFSQVVTLPDSLEYDDVDLWFRLSSGEFVYPSVERVNSTSFKIYTNDSSLAYVAYCR